MGFVRASATVTMILFMLGACGGEETVQCIGERDHLSGDYLLSIVEQDGGDCGRMSPVKVELKNGVVVPHDAVGCQLTSDDWAQDSCSNHSVFMCDDGEWTMRLEWVVYGYGEAQDQISGELHTELDRWNGLYTCSSTYSFLSIQ